MSKMILIIRLLIFVAIFVVLCVVIKQVNTRRRLNAQRTPKKNHTGKDPEKTKHKD